MEKKVFEDDFLLKLNKNFERQSQYFDFEFYVLSELGTSIFEINKCLILEFYRASITLTNNVLERLLKLALIYNEVGIEPKPLDNWNEIFVEPNKKYGTIQLGNSIELCKKLGLLTAEEKTFLFDTIRELMRNGFSHYDTSKILENIPEETTFFSGSFSNPTELSEVKMNQKVIPIFQSLQVENFAKQNALFYFDYVFKLIKSIEERLKSK